jgi:hypothetical protein
MAAQTLSAAARTEEAKKMLADGIASAQRTGNAHAQSEMEAMLDGWPRRGRRDLLSRVARPSPAWAGVFGGRT